MKLSIVIPAYNRLPALKLVLAALRRQTSKEFEVVVSDDGSTDNTLAYLNGIRKEMPYHLTLATGANRGPAAARNRGARAATGEVLAFIGDDCIPDPEFVFQHLCAHTRYPGRKAVQGLTLWHRDVADDFAVFLTEVSGIQTNMRALRDEKGRWKERVDGFFLTTNVSISRGAFESTGGFCEKFPAAAWEDIHLGYLLQIAQTPTYFNPHAINYHRHRMTLDGYVHRQQIEGKSRLVLCAEIPEFAQGLIDFKSLREYREDDFVRAVAEARELHYNKSPDVQEARQRRWGRALQLASIKGTLAGINERGGVWLALPDIHTGELARHVTDCAAALARGDTAYAQQAIEWALNIHRDNHALHAARGEVMLACGDRLEAIAEFQRAIVLGPGNKWAKRRLEELG